MYKMGTFRPIVGSSSFHLKYLIYYHRLIQDAQGQTRDLPP